MMKLEFTAHSPRKGVGAGNKSRTRPLGSVRLSNSMETVPKFPPLTNGKTPRMEPSYEGISGNRMAVPPPKVASEPAISRAESQTKYSDRGSVVPPRILSPAPARKHSSHSVHSQRNGCGCTHAAEVVQKDQELKDAMSRERELKEQVMQFQKIIDELKQQIWEKDKTIEDLHEQFKRQEDNYKQLYTSECVKHESTRQVLQTTTYDLEKKTEECESIKQEYDQKLIDLQMTMDNRLAEERAEKDREISIRDEKLNKLKKQMAETLKGNSWERQQQLDELSKELQRVQEESEMLKMRLKALSKGGGGSTGRGGGSGSCSNCDVMRKQLSASQNVIKERELSIQELKTICSKFERQLDQQDSLLKQFAETKGYKPPQNFKKK